MATADASQADAPKKKPVKGPTKRPQPFRDPPMAPPPTRDDPIVRRTAVGVGVHAAVALGATLVPALRGVHVVVALALFLAGSVLMVGGFLSAIQRSREEVVDLATTFLLISAKPTSTARALLGLLVLESAVAVGAAAAHPYTSLAFGVLAPLWAWGSMVSWSARHASYRGLPPRARR